MATTTSRSGTAQAEDTARQVGTSQRAGGSRGADAVRLHVVTGKGGTGKTTIAAALALALASNGRRVLLCEVEGRQGLASLFDAAPLPYDERRIAVGPDGGEVFALAIDAEAALLEYLDMFYRLGRAGKALDRFGVIDFATTIAPGVRDVLLTGKVYEATRRQDGGRPTYDSVVLDAPPTGRISRFLNVNTEVAGIAKVGPIRKQATSIMQLLKSPKTRVHVVTSLEEMPVQETLDGITELTRIGLPLGVVVVNLVREPELAASDLVAASADRLDTAQIAASLKEAGIKVGDSVVAGLADEARQHAERVALEGEQRARLAASRRPTVEVPFLTDGIDLGSLYDIAERLSDSEEI
ncbi:MAG: ArsA-related P-loop ATPase [Nocardioidaceae bacterium]